jgi:hypothetical protein
MTSIVVLIKIGNKVDSFHIFPSGFSRLVRTSHRADQWVLMGDVCRRTDSISC